MKKRGPWSTILSFAALCVALLGLVGSARAATRVEALVIGNNHAPLQAESSRLRELRFADDDAAAFYEFIMHLANAGHLLTLMDRDTQALYPELVPIAKIPSLNEVKLAVAEIRKRLEEYKAAGDRSVVFVFFSGHGSRGAQGVPELALIDGGITQKFLYEDVLARLPADVIHLFVDACHAEAVVRPRDTRAELVDVSIADASAFLAESTLAGYSRVGAIVAAANDAQAHEWDQLRQGIFTYELLSALRGGADVNRDARIEYSEVYAFLSAANRAIDDPRARLSVVARAPDINGRLPIITLTELRKAKLAWLTGIPDRAGLVHVEDEAGRNLATVRAESGFSTNLVLPANSTLYIKANNKEVRLRAAAGQAVPYYSLSFTHSSSRQRGALEEAVRGGLFATRFGPGYYSGFIDRSSDFVSVALPVEHHEAQTFQHPNTTAPNPARHRYDLAVGVGITDVVADSLSLSHSLRLGIRPTRTSGPHAELDAAYASGQGLLEWRGTASVGWLWLVNYAQISGYWGFGAGAGVIGQTMTEERKTRSSFVVTVAPMAGFSTRVGSRFSIWAEAQALALLYRRDARTAVTLGPAVWLGGALAL